MNMFTARGLAETAYAEQCDILVVVHSTAIRNAVRHFEQAVIDLGLPVRRVRRANGHESIEFNGDGTIRILPHGRGSLRGHSGDVVYFDLHPSELDASDAMLVTAPSMRGLIVEP